ncbi:unnamed protein product [Pleuronectes platessa]|uniref:Uncharacterized protein n=1 Tax=Pleuronectes platessa TaxID=8262 RepID=A0A9N7UA50_PLEPL|nr:unnamed protein product [Pleuronectes platessa]
MSKQDSVTSVAFAERSLRGRVMRAVTSSMFKYVHMPVSAVNQDRNPFYPMGGLPQPSVLKYHLVVKGDKATNRVQAVGDNNARASVHLCSHQCVWIASKRICLDLACSCGAKADTHDSRCELSGINPVLRINIQPGMTPPPPPPHL